MGTQILCDTEQQAVIVDKSVIVELEAEEQCRRVVQVLRSPSTIEEETSTINETEKFVLDCIGLKPSMNALSCQFLFWQVSVLTHWHGR